MAGQRFGTARISTAGRRGCRQPSPTSEVPGLKRDANGKYLEPIGSGRDPLKVFTVVNDVDGRPAIRISGEVFGELRTKGSFKDYHLKLQFKWGRRNGRRANRPETRARQRAAVSRARCARRRGTHLGAIDRVADSGSTTSAISTPWARRLPSARSARRHQPPCTTMTLRASGRSSHRARARPAGASSSRTTRTRPASGTPSS